MPILQGFITGTVVGLFITLIPGMLNLQVVSTAVRIGRRGAIRFSWGLILVIGLQAVLAVAFANWMARHPQILTSIEQWGVLMLFLLGVGFTIKGYRTRKAGLGRPYRGGPFWRGVMMSAMNVMNIPLLLAIAGFSIARGWLPEGIPPRIAFVPGVMSGAFLSFYGYVRTAPWIHQHADYLTRNIYFILGGLLFLLAVVQGISVVEF